MQLTQNQSSRQPQKRSSKCIKQISNCTLTCPTTESDGRYYQISIPEGPTIRIYFMNQSVIRVRVSFESPPQFLEQSYGLILTGWDDQFDKVVKGRRKVKLLTTVNFQQVKCDLDGGAYYQFETNELNGKIYKNPYGIQICNKSGITIYKDLRGRCIKQDLQSRIYHYTELSTDDKLYGFGQTTGPLNKHHQYIRQSPQDNLGYDAQRSSPLYKHIPFYIKINKENKHAIGVFYNNTYDCSFDVGRERSGYWGQYMYYCADGGQIDYFVINGPSMKRVVQRFTDLTGKTAMAPREALGYLGSTMFYAQLEENCDQAILDFVDKCRKQNIPISNFHLSSGYTLSSNKQTPKRNTLTWNNKKFPNPQTFFELMHKEGVSVSPNVKPGMLLTHPLYKQFQENHAFIKNPDNHRLSYIDRWWGGDGSFVDFTDPKARQLWKNYLKQRIIKKGTSSIWNDNNQYESIDDKAALCASDQQDPQTYGNAGQYRNVQALLMAQVAQQAIKQSYPDVRPYIVSRSGCAGIQRFASSWSGDNYTSWKTLQANIATILNMGLSGVANYGCDVGGFWGPAPEPQLLLRWVQHGIFQPRFSIHSCNSDNTVTQPWMYPQFSSLISKAIRFRYVLLPYLYSLLYFSHIKGRPIMRALAYEFQDTDFQICSEQSKSFMFGPYMLISNIIQPIKDLSKPFLNNQIKSLKFPQIHRLVPNCIQKFNIKRNRKFQQQHGYQEVYLPKGCNWYSWDGKNRIVGGTKINIQVGLDSIPIFIKDKSIIPLAYRFGKGEDISEMNKQQITGLYVKIVYEIDQSELQKNFPKQKPLQFTLFQDNGTSPLTTQQSEQPSDRTLQYRLNPPLAPNSSYMLIKFAVRYGEYSKQQKKSQSSTIFNENMLIVDINRQGNIDRADVNSFEDIVLEIRSGEKAPNWVTVSDMLCKRAMYEEQWVAWNSQQNLNKDEQIVEPGCWYYDVETHSTLLKLHQNLSKPDNDKARNIQIKICKDKLIQFTKQYEKISVQSQNNRIKDEVIVHDEQIEERIGQTDFKKVRERKRIIARDNSANNK